MSRPDFFAWLDALFDQPPPTRLYMSLDTRHRLATVMGQGKWKRMANQQRRAWAQRRRRHQNGGYRG